MADETTEPLAFEEPQAPRKVYLWLSYSSARLAPMYGLGEEWIPVARPATEADLAALGFVRKP